MPLGDGTGPQGQGPRVPEEVRGSAGLGRGRGYMEGSSVGSDTGGYCVSKL